MKIKIKLFGNCKDIFRSNVLQINFDKYGLGAIRSLEDFYNFAGVNIKNKTVKDKKILR